MPHQFEIGDRVRVVPDGTTHNKVIGVVVRIERDKLGARTKHGPQYYIEVNGLSCGWRFAAELIPEDKHEARPA